MLRCMLALLVLLVSFDTVAQRPPAVEPARRDTVIEQLPKGYSALMPRTTTATDPVAQIETLLAIAARTGDGRLVARAQTLIDAQPEAVRSRPRLLRAAAYAAQYRHDFTTALRLLDRAVSADARDGDARLARAQIHIVQGRLDQARGECTALALGIDADHGLICVAALAFRRGESQQAAALLDRMLANPGGSRETRRHTLVLRADVASRANDARADAFFKQALKLAPSDVRTLAAYSRHLRNHGRAADAYRLLQQAPDTDHLRLERALAARASGHPQAAVLERELAARFAAARALGSEPDLHDEAEFLLTLRNQPAQALVLAQRNFVDQRDHEDVELLRRAAQAARQPDAWRGVREWAVSQRLELPRAAGGDA